MHLKKVVQKTVALGLTFSLCIANVVPVSATVPEMDEEIIVTDEKEEENTSEGDKDTDTSENEDLKIPAPTPEIDGEKTGEQDIVPEDNDIPGENPEQENKEEQSEVEKDSEEDSVILEGEFVDQTQKEYRVDISGVELQGEEVLQAAVWSLEKDQDDIKWMNLEKEEDGRQSLVFRISDFKSAGEYILHIYKVSAEGKKTFVKGKRFLVDVISSGKAEVIEKKYEEGKALIKISGMTAPSGINKVKVAIWSAKDQNDIFWYEAGKKEDGWYVDMDIAKYHKNNMNVYKIHSYAVDGNGFQKFTGGTTVDFKMETVKPQIKIEKENCSVSFDDSAISIPGGVKSIRIAAWSEANGQDDIAWYNMKYNVFVKKWTQDFSLKQLKSIGNVFVHAYVTNNKGKEIFLGSEQFKVEAPSMKTLEMETDNDTGDFTINLRDINAPMGIQKVEVAIWSAADMNDCIWYTAEKSGEDYAIKSNISKHKYNVGDYNVHVYVTDGLGIKTCVKCVPMKFKAEIGKLAVEVDSKETLYKATLSGVKYPTGLKEVRFAVWSRANGQDDVRWYTAVKKGNTYEAEIDIRNHRTAGIYVTHVYGTDQAGGQHYLTGSSKFFNISGYIPGKLEISNVNESKGTATATAIIDSVPSGISSVRVAVWSSANQNNMYWYAATKQSNGTWTTNIDISKHKYYSGTYNVHAYATMGNGIEACTACSSVKIEPRNLLYVEKTADAKRRIGIVNPSNTANLRVAVWSDKNGQDDVRWYNAKNLEGGVWYVDITGYDFKNAGSFSTHVYSGGTALATTSFHMSEDEVRKNGWIYEKFNGKTYKVYYDKGKMLKDVSGIIGRQSSYMAEINRTTCTVTVYAKDGANGFIIPVKAFTCSVGLPATPTPLGKFYTLAKYRWSELMGPSYGQYCTRIVGGILFHSVAGSNMTSYNISAVEYNKLGQPASHGCVRLNVRDAKWIYDNCGLGMEVNIIDSSYPGPYGKPATIKIPAGQNWDPTDPNI